MMDTCRISSGMKGVAGDWLFTSYSNTSITGFSCNRQMDDLLQRKRYFSIPHSWTMELLTTGCPGCQKGLESTWTNQCRINLSETIKCKGVTAAFRGPQDTNCWKLGDYARKITLCAYNIISVPCIFVIARFWKRDTGLSSDTVILTVLYC